MNYSEDHIALAAEYALGTLNAEERALVETMMIVDHGFKEVVEAWDRKLSPLHQMVVPIEPPAHLWGNISAVLGLGKTEAAPPVEEPQPESPPVQEAPVAAAAPVSPVPGEASPGEPEAVVDTPVTVTSADQFDYTPLPSPPENVAPVATGSDVADAEQAAPELVADSTPSRDSGTPELIAELDAAHLSNAAPAIAERPRRREPVFGWVMTAIAAALAGVIALQAYRPDLLPEGLRVKPKVQVVNVPAPPAPQPAQFVAVLQQTSAAPAFILTVDTATKTFTVRKVGAAPTSGKSYELWLVSDKLTRPRSLGVIGGSDFTIRPSLADYDSDMINRATYAVTLEPEGGSPSGVATGPIVYAGTLVESVPELPAPPR